MRLVSRVVMLHNAHMTEADTYTGPVFATHATRWRTRFGGALVSDLAVLARQSGTTSAFDTRAGVTAAAHDLAGFARDGAAGRELIWVKGEVGIVVDVPHPLRAGGVALDSNGAQQWVNIRPSLSDCESMALVELALVHANGHRLALAQLLRIVVSRGAEVARLRAKRIYPVGG